MRQIFVDNLCQEAEKNPDIWLLTADLGYSFLESFAESFPDRFINVGVAEQNMIGIAAGLALSGKKVFVYSIINFLILRCFEQIRHDIVYHNLDVKLVGIGGGFSYGSAGYSHHGLEDINLMSSLTDIHIFAPSRATEIVENVLYMSRVKTPCYLRLDKVNLSEDFQEKESLQGSEKQKLLVFGYGSLVNDLLGIFTENVKVISLNCIHPINTEKVLKEAIGFKKILILEEHVESLVSLRLERILFQDSPKRDIQRLFVRKPYFSVSGDHVFLKDKNSLSSLELIQHVSQFLKKVDGT